MAVANGQVIAHLQGDASAALTLLLSGGPILYLVAQSWYLWAAPRVSPRLRLIGSATLPRILTPEELLERLSG